MPDRQDEGHADEHNGWHGLISEGRAYRSEAVLPPAISQPHDGEAGPLSRRQECLRSRFEEQRLGGNP